MKTNFTGKPRKKGATTNYEARQLRKEAQEIAKKKKAKGLLVRVPFALPPAWVEVRANETKQQAFERYNRNRVEALRFASRVDL